MSWNPFSGMGVAAFPQTLSLFQTAPDKALNWQSKTAYRIWKSSPTRLISTRSSKTCQKLTHAKMLTPTRFTESLQIKRISMPPSHSRKMDTSQCSRFLPSMVLFSLTQSPIVTLATCPYLYRQKHGSSSGAFFKAPSTTHSLSTIGPQMIRIHYNRTDRISQSWLKNLRKINIAASIIA